MEIERQKMRKRLAMVLDHLLLKLLTPPSDRSEELRAVGWVDYPLTHEGAEPERGSHGISSASEQEDPASQSGRSLPSIMDQGPPEV